MPNQLIDLTKLLPSNQIGKPSEDIVKASQEVLQDFLNENGETLKSSIRLESMTSDNARNYVERFGYNFFAGDGYTATTSYFKKEAQTIVGRLKSKTSIRCYEKIFYIYNLTGYVYPLLVNGDGQLEPWIEWNEFPATTEEESNILDQGYEDDGVNPFSPADPARSLDEDMDDLGIPILGADQRYVDDPASAYGALVKQILVSYEPLIKVSTGEPIVEKYNEVMYVDTAKSFYHNVLQFKRLVEVPHFEFRLKIKVGDSGSTKITNYIQEDGSPFSPDPVIQISRLFSGRSISNSLKVQFGTGAHSNSAVSAESIIGCQSPIDLTTYGITNDGAPNYRSDLINFNKINIDANQLSFRNFILPNLKWFEFTELCIFDNLNNIVLYSRFPKVVFFQEMLSSVYVQIDKI